MQLLQGRGDLAVRARALTNGLSAISRLEVRELWRSVRARVFLLLLVSVTLLAFLLGSQLHGAYSTEYAVIGFLGPRFFMSQFGVYLLILAFGGALFIALVGGDTGGFAQRNGVAEGVACRPVSNAVLLGGRLIALVATTWLAMLVALAVAQGIGAATRGFDAGAVIEPFSVASFLLVDALPAAMAWCALVVLLHAVLRSRLLVALAGSALLGLFWSALSLPAWAQPVVVPVAALERHVSEVAPWFFDGRTLLQRGSMLGCAAGALMVAAGLHRRRDDGRTSMLCSGGVFVLAGCAGLGLFALFEAGRNAQREAWLAAHELASRESVGFDVERLTGNVAIDPGAELGIDIVLRVKAHRDLRALVFSLNPAMRVADLRVADEGAGFRHEDGLLTIDLPAPVGAGNTLTLALVASGVPDPDFAYLDSAVDPRRVAASNSIRLLGTEALIFDRAYVALMPAALWLPAAGANYGREDPSRRPRDFFDVDLAVEAPATWHVAGASVAQPDARAEGARRFRYRPAMAVDGVGLLAAAFDRRVLQAGGVEIELLFHPNHLNNVDLFAGVGDVVADHAEEILDHLESQGIGYPYASLSIVEVPAHLRSYRGGWRMGPALRLPGSVGVREVAFPTANFEALMAQIDNVINTPEIAAAAKAGHLITYARQAGLLRGLANSFLNTVAGATGDDALALELLCLELANRLLPRPNPPRMESAHLFDKDASPGLLMELLPSLSGGTRSVFRDLLARFDPSADRPSVWDNLTSGVLEASTDRSRTQGVLALRASKTAQAIMDWHGPGKSAALLRELRNRHAGGNFTVADFAAVADSLGLPVAPLLDGWLHGSALPRFVPSTAHVVRLADDESGPRYQARLHVRNESAQPECARGAQCGGDAPGLVALSTDRYGFDGMSPVVVDAQTSVELDWVGSEPPAALWLQPYLSANRHPFAIQVEKPIDGAPPAPNAAAPFGARASDWKPPREPGVIVDDLDPGFAVETDAEDQWRFRLLDSATVPPLDQGLPLYDGYERAQAALRPDTWHREVLPSAWGRYRRTIALVDAGDGGARAVASAHVPRDGRWELAFHIPPAAPPDFPGESAPPAHRSFLGSYDMVLRTATGETPVEFDGHAAQFGWNALGTFEMSAGEVQLVLSNRTSGQIVVFDAIRWRGLKSSNP